MSRMRCVKGGIGFAACSTFLALVMMLVGEERLRADDGDWHEWSEASWTQRLGSGFDAGLRLETRLEDDISQFSYYEVEPMVTWRYSPRWDFTMAYERDERLRPKEEVIHDPNLSAVLRIPRQPYRLFPVLDWRFSNRFRMDFMVPENEMQDWQLVYRNRTDWEARWRWGSKELVPFVFEEWFYNLDQGDLVENRLGIGLGVPIASHWMARIYFMRDDIKIDGHWEWHPVLGLQIQTQF